MKNPVHKLHQDRVFDLKVTGGAIPWQPDYMPEESGAGLPTYCRWF